MKHKLFLPFTLISVINLYAQNGIHSSGGIANGSGGNVSYSIGQITYNTNIDANTSITEGVQQPFEISTLSLTSVEKMDISIFTYPNPTSDALTIEIENKPNKEMVYSLFNLEGKLIEKSKIVTTKTTILMNRLEKATYLLHIADNDKILNTYKIVKN